MNKISEENGRGEKSRNESQKNTQTWGKRERAAEERKEAMGTMVTIAIHFES